MSLQRSIIKICVTTYLRKVAKKRWKQLKFMWQIKVES